MADYRENAREFLKEFLPYIQFCNEPWAYKAAVRTYNKEHGTHIVVKNGATRVAVIGRNFVVKFDYGTDRCYFGGCYDEYRFYRDTLRNDSEMAACLMECSKIKVEHHFYYVMPRATRIGELSTYVFSDEEEDWIFDHVNDTHDGNIGWYNGRPVIIDYACRI